jgi:hypothetical protein
MVKEIGPTHPLGERFSSRLTELLKPQMHTFCNGLAGLMPHKSR